MRKVLIPMFLPEWLFRLRVWLALRYRKFRYGCTFRKIPLTQGQYAIVDPEDYKELSKYKWFAKRCDRRFYAERSYKNKNVKMHEVIMGTVAGKVIDHINQNGLNNRKSNLRFATTEQNAWNKRKQKGDYSSKYKGVHWVKSRKKWRARIICKGTGIFLGCFDNEDDAAKAYDEKAKELFGEYAVLNLKGESAVKRIKKEA